MRIVSRTRRVHVDRRRPAAPGPPATPRGPHATEATGPAAPTPPAAPSPPASPVPLAVTSPAPCPPPAARVARGGWTSTVVGGARPPPRPPSPPRTCSDTPRPRAVPGGPPGPPGPAGPPGPDGAPAVPWRTAVNNSLLPSASWLPPESLPARSRRSEAVAAASCRAQPSRTHTAQPRSSNQPHRPHGHRPRENPRPSLPPLNTRGGSSTSRGPGQASPQSRSGL